MALDPNRIFSGTDSALTFENRVLSEALSFKATLSVNKEKVPRLGSKLVGYRETNMEGKGTMKLHKIDSYILSLVTNGIANGIWPKFTATSTIYNPSTRQTEKVTIKGISLDGIDAANWEVDKLLQEEHNFTFDEYKTEVLAK